MKSKNLSYAINFQRIFFMIAIVCIVIIGLYIQLTTLMNSDGANGINEARLLFFGGKYFKDFFEITPPMFLYINLPIIFFKNNFQNVNLFSIIFYYYNFLIIFSIIVSSALLKKMFNFDSQYFKSLLILVITFNLFIFCSYYTFQREAMAFIFTLPYFLLFAMRLKNEKIIGWFALLVGACGGIGFSIKPHLAIPFILSEFFLLYNRKSISKIWRAENLTIYTIFFSYIVSTYFLYPAYFYKMIPLSIKIYYAGISSSFWHVFTQTNFIYVACSIACYFLIKNKYKKIELIDSVAIAVIGYTISYVLQFIPWFYHLLPAFLFSMILNFLLVYLFGENTFLEKDKKCFFIVFLIFNLFNSYFYYINLKNNPIFNFYAQIFILMLIVSFTTFAAIKKYFLTRFFKGASVIVFAIALFNAPIYLSFQSYGQFMFYTTLFNPIVKFLDDHANHKSVYFLTPAPLFEFPAVTYSNAISVSRFPFLVWLPAYTFEEIYHPGTKAAIRMLALHHYFMKLLSEDVALKKPHFIFVYASASINTYDFPVTNFNLLNLFLKNAEFAAVWKNYHYDQSINVEPYYKLDIYKLKSSRRSSL